MKRLLFVSIFILWFLLPLGAHAATLSFSPSSGTFKLGDTFSVNILVNTEGTSVNAFSGKVSYPTDKLDFISSSKAGSLLTFWTIDPVKEDGVVRYEGVIFNPGYNGSYGQIIKLTFKVKALGAGTLSFASSSVLANDGLGTNVLDTVGTATFVFGATSPISSTPGDSNTPLAPVVSSTTHPDPNKWYSSSSPQISWQIDSDIIGVSASIDQNPTGNPGTKSKGKITSYAPGVFVDGVWYAHVRLQNSSGWGAISHFRIQIDTVKPSLFTIESLPDQTTKDDPFRKFKFTATDELSGIEHYEVVYDTGHEETWYDDGTHIYTTPHLHPGKHLMAVKAVDGAGNTLSNSVDFSIVALEKPTIDEYPRHLRDGDFLIASGHTYPNAKITIYMKRQTDDADLTSGTIFYERDGHVVEQNLLADKNGLFTFAYDERVKYGVYSLYAVATLDTGAESLPSDTVSILVSETWFQSIIHFLIRALILVIPFIGLLALLLALLWYIWYRYKLFKMRVRREIYETQNTINLGLGGIDEDVHREILILQKLHRGEPLAEEELTFLHKLDQEIETARNILTKDVGRIDERLGP